MSARAHVHKPERSVRDASSVRMTARSSDVARSLYGDATEPDEGEDGETIAASLVRSRGLLTPTDWAENSRWADLAYRLIMHGYNCLDAWSLATAILGGDAEEPPGLPAYDLAELPRALSVPSRAEFDRETSATTTPIVETLRGFGRPGVCGPARDPLDSARGPAADGVDDLSADGLTFPRVAIVGWA